MEFHEKLQALRKQKELTQEELADALFVSRTAVSKWESGRGYPSIESLKAISKFYAVTIDELLSSEEVLTLAEEDRKQKETRFLDVVFGLLDCSAAMFFLLPFFGQTVDGMIQEVSLLSLTGVTSCLKIAYYAVAIGMIVYGILTLAFQNSRQAFWLHNKHRMSLLITGFGVILFIIGRQPYAAVFLFVFMAIKVFISVKRQ